MHAVKGLRHARPTRDKVARQGCQDCQGVEELTQQLGVVRGLINTQVYFRQKKYSEEGKNADLMVNSHYFLVIFNAYQFQNLYMKLELINWSEREWSNGVQ